MMSRKEGQMDAGARSMDGSDVLEGVVVWVFIVTFMAAVARYVVANPEAVHRLLGQ